ncbi:MAG: PQQ-binding-like beta-propeller repeat protein [Vulcanimicrobiota bacterium]
MNLELIERGGRLPARTLWKTETSGWTYEPLVIEDQVIVSCADKTLQAYDLEGHRLWSQPAGFSTQRPAASPDGQSLYLATHENKLMAFDRQGQPRWQFSEGWGGFAEPAVGPDGTIYVGSTSRLLLALNPDGSEKWRYQTETGVKSQPVIGKHVYVADSTGHISALSPETGEALWTVDTKQVYQGPLAIGRDGSVLQAQWKKLVAFDPETGEVRWETEAHTPHEAGPSVDREGRIFVSSTEGGLDCFSPEGQKLWSATTDKALVTTPVVGADGTIVARDFARDLWAFSPKGLILWRQETFTPSSATIVSDPAIGPNGIVYSGNQDNSLSAYEGLTFEEYLASLPEPPKLEEQDGWLVVGDHPVPIEA